MEALLVTPPEREYELQQVHKQAFDRKQPKQRYCRHDSRVLTAAYRRFVGLFYERNKPVRETFIRQSVPWLVRNTSRGVTAILAGLWFTKHGKGSRGAFMREVLQAIERNPLLQNGLQTSLLKTDRDREAYAIALHLASLSANGEFPLPSRELQLRLLLSRPAVAWRILQRLTRSGHLKVVDAGISRPAASAKGEKARAAVYRLARS